MEKNTFSERERIKMDVLEQIKERCFIKTAGNDIGLIGATRDDQDFIANARQDIPWLINEVYRLRKRDS